MISSGVINMPLHFGKMPNWLSERMGLLGAAVIESIVQNYGKSEVLTRLSDPNYFQALGAAAGFQYNSSGVTATLLGAMRRKLNPKANELGLYLLGGKGKSAWRAPSQIARVAERHGLKGDELVRSCELTRRVDQNTIQDGYNLYQQHFIISDEGEWAGISQGLNQGTRRARRYHWRSRTVRSFVSDPHVGIVGEPGQSIVNLVDARADDTRKHIVELTKENPQEVLDAYRQAEIHMGNYHDVRNQDVNLKRLGAVLAMAHGGGIDQFEDLVMFKGVGPRTLRSLALTSELIHGDATRFEDPARFSFLAGGKDGNPGPIDRKALDETIQHLQESVEQSKLGYNDKSKALKRLHRATRHLEETHAPEADLEQLKKSEWEYAEKNGGWTFMGPVIKGVTRAAFSMQNTLLYGGQRKGRK